MQASTSPVMPPIIIKLLLLITLVAAAEHSGGSPMSCSQMCHYIEWGRDAYCAGRNLTEVPQCCSDSELLDLRQNNLRTLEGHQFHNFTNLRFLDLSGNNLDELPIMTFEGASQLEDVYLMYNQFTIIRHRTFAGSERIQTMYINNNFITGIQRSAFQQLGNLRVLYLSHNELTYVSRHQFEYNTRLTHISLANNHIEVLHKSTFQNLRHLVFLDLSYNKIQVFDPSIFGTLPALETLTIANNSLTSDIVSDLLLDAPSLKELNVQYNLIQTIPENLNEAHLSKLRLANNPLTCDCSFKSLQELYLNHRGKEWVEDAYCVSGEQLISVPLECDESSSSPQYVRSTTVNSDTTEIHRSSPLTPFILVTGIITIVCLFICLFVVISWIKSCCKQRVPPPHDKSKGKAPPPYTKDSNTVYVAVPISA